jgi:hypothetical protein
MGLGLHAFYIDGTLVKCFYTKSDDIEKQQCPSETIVTTKRGRVKRIARVDIPDDFEVSLSPSHLLSSSLSQSHLLSSSLSPSHLLSSSLFLSFIVSHSRSSSRTLAHRLALSLIVSHSRSSSPTLAHRLTFWLVVSRSCSSSHFLAPRLTLISTTNHVTQLGYKGMMINMRFKYHCNQPKRGSNTTVTTTRDLLHYLWFDLPLSVLIRFKYRRGRDQLSFPIVARCLVWLLRQ